MSEKRKPRRQLPAEPTTTIRLDYGWRGTFVVKGPDIDAEREAQRVRTLLGGKRARGGRRDELVDRLSIYSRGVLQVASTTRHRSEITATKVLYATNRVNLEEQLRKDMARPQVGGWHRFVDWVLDDPE